MEDTLSRLPPVVLVVTYLALWMVEWFYATDVQIHTGPRRRRNLVISFIGFAVAGLTGATLLALASFVESAKWGLSGMTMLPVWAIALFGILLLDLADYWRHRVSHALPVLWRLHRLHHSDPHIDVTTTLRSHPLELGIRPLFLAVAVALFGIPILPVLLFPVLQLPILVFQHTDVRLPYRFDRALAWLIVTPGMHVLHHSRAAPETNSNYATFLSIWDRLFGSFCPSTRPKGIGLDGFDDEQSQTLAGMLAEPWRRRTPNGAATPPPGVVEISGR